jgi:hypothetical protein
MRASRGSPSVSYLDLADSGEALITVTQYSEIHLKEVGLMVFDAGHWYEDGGCLRLNLHRMAESGDSGFYTKYEALPAEFLLKEAAFVTGVALESVSAIAEDGEQIPSLDLRLLPTGNLAARKSFVVAKSLRWMHGTSDMILCLCADKRIITVKEHEHETVNGEVHSFRTISQPHGCWFELGSLLVVTFNHRGVEQSASTHALFFDTAQRVYKGLITWSYEKVRLHAGEVEARAMELPKAPCFSKSSSLCESPGSIPAVVELELPTETQCIQAYHGLSPSNANLVCNDYIVFLLKLMASNGLDHMQYVQLAQQFMKVIDLSSYFCTSSKCPTWEDMLDSFQVRHKKVCSVTAYSLAGDELCRHHVDDAVGASAALIQLTKLVQPWEDALLQIDLIGADKEDGMIAQYNFQAVRVNVGGHSLEYARERLKIWGLHERYLPSQFGMVLQGVCASARYQLIQEYFGQLRCNLECIARNPLRGSHYIVLLDVSGSMSFERCLQGYDEEIAEMEGLGLDASILKTGTNLEIVEHILDSFFVPQLLQSGAQVGNAKFSNRVVRVEDASDKPTPFCADRHLDGGGTEIYHSLMEVAAHLTLPVLDMTGDVGVILITDGEQPSTKMDVANLARLFNRNFRLEVIGIRARLEGPLKQLIRGSFSVPYQIGNLKNFMTSLSETLARIRQRIAMTPESRRDIRQAAELYHTHMWYLLDED